MPRRSTLRQPVCKPDTVLYAEFISALTRVVEHNETACLHGVTISYPCRAGSFALHIEMYRTVRDPWDGSLHYAKHLRGGDASRPKRVATDLALAVKADEARRERMLAEARPGILNGSVTHVPEVA